MEEVVCSNPASGTGREEITKKASVFLAVARWATYFFHTATTAYFSTPVKYIRNFFNIAIKITHVNYASSKISCGVHYMQTNM